MTYQEYKAAFGIVGATERSDPKRALDLALEIRRFEIDLYWRRATYFWAFLAVTFAGYFALLAAKDMRPGAKGEALLTVLCLGVVFSVAWYFVNRASKFWQENWESHVDLLENAVTGPLYKTVLNVADLRITNWSGPYPFSVSKINQLLSLFVALLFVVLLLGTMYEYYRPAWPPHIDGVSTAVLLLTTAAVVTLYYKGRTQLHLERSVVARSRTTRIVD
jgi:hypothetical protein